MNKDSVKFGIKNVHYAPFNEGSGTEYSVPKPMPGARALNLEPVGEDTPFYADDKIYFRAVSNEGYTAELEVAYVPADFLKDIFQYKEGATSKVLTENANSLSKPFALLFEEEGDETGTKYVAYKCTATRPKRSLKTKEKSIDPQTQSLPLTIEPLDDGTVIAFTQETTPAETLNSWYTKVHKEV